MVKITNGCDAIKQKPHLCIYRIGVVSVPCIAPCAVKKFRASRTLILSIPHNELQCQNNNLKITLSYQKRVSSLIRHTILADMTKRTDGFPIFSGMTGNFAPP